jgi:hypothetical protein
MHAEPDGRQEAVPSLRDGRADELELAHLSREQVFQQAQEALDQVGRIGFILAPGCALPTDINPELLFAIREFAERV